MPEVTPTRKARSFVLDEIGSIVKMTIPSGGNAGDYLVNWNGHGDVLHLLRIKADGTTELANSFAYSTWGEPTITGTPVNSATGQPYGDLGFRYLYVGEFDVQWDNTFGLGLHYMHARHYAPALGRFLQPDPDGLEDSLYGYAANNPVTEMDPDGTCFIVCLVVGAVMDAAIYAATTENASLGGAIGAVARGAVESAINPLGKIGRVSKALTAINRVVNKAPKASRHVARAQPIVRRGGETAAAAAGRAKHRALATQTRAKAAATRRPWQSEPLMTGASGRKLRPDIVTPNRRFIELKPNTPSGRRAGTRQAAIYRAELGMRGRVIYYGPRIN